MRKFYRKLDEPSYSPFTFPYQRGNAVINNKDFSFTRRLKEHQLTTLDKVSIRNITPPKKTILLQINETIFGGQENTPVFNQTSETDKDEYSSSDEEEEYEGGYGEEEEKEEEKEEKKLTPKQPPRLQTPDLNNLRINEFLNDTIDPKYTARRLINLQTPEDQRYFLLKLKMIDDNNLKLLSNRSNDPVVKNNKYLNSIRKKAIEYDSLSKHSKRYKEEYQTIAKQYAYVYKQFNTKKELTKTQKDIIKGFSQVLEYYNDPNNSETKNKSNKGDKSDKSDKGDSTDTDSTDTDSILTIMSIIEDLYSNELDDDEQFNKNWTRGDIKNFFLMEWSLVTKNKPLDSDYYINDGVPNIKKYPEIAIKVWANIDEHSD